MSLDEYFKKMVKEIELSSRTSISIKKKRGERFILLTNNVS